MIGCLNKMFLQGHLPFKSNFCFVGNYTESCNPETLMQDFANTRNSKLLQ